MNVTLSQLIGVWILGIISYMIIGGWVYIIRDFIKKKLGKKNNE